MSLRQKAFVQVVESPVDFGEVPEQEMPMEWLDRHVFSASI